MDLNVLYFAHVRARVGCSEERVTVADGATVGDVVAALCERYPQLTPLMPSVRVAVDGEFCRDADAVRDGSEFVLIPPVAGGSGTQPVALTQNALTPDNLRALSSLVGGASRGAVVTFEGVVRDHARGKAVTRLFYEAYPSMALAVMRKIVDGIEAEIPAARVAVHHRTGMLEIGDCAVQIAAASAHRAEAFDACRLVIDRLKQDCPIWKREIGPDGDEWVSDRP